MAKVARNGTRENPVALYQLIDATSRTVSVDDTLTNAGLRSLARSLHGLRPSGLTFLNAPVAGRGREGAQSVVHLDQTRSAQLWTALRDGSVPAYAARYPADVLPAAPV